MGEVWRADDLQSGEQVALKILHPELARQQGFVDLLQSEYDVAQSLAHPNIVRVYAVHHDAGYHFIAMEYVDGFPLSRLRGESWYRIVEAVLPLADALEFASSIRVGPSRH